MKKFKGIMVLLVVLVMVFGMTVTASAATTYKDGSYDTASTPDANNNYFKLHVEVVGGAVDSAIFMAYNGEYSFEAMAQSPSLSKEQLDGINGMIQGCKAYEDMLNSTKDGSAVNALSGDTTIYPAFTDSWDQFVEAAGMEEVNNNTTTDVPKTGVIDFGMIYGLGAIATAVFALRKKVK